MNFLSVSIIPYSDFLVKKNQRMRKNRHKKHIPLCNQDVLLILILFVSDYFTGTIQPNGSSSLPHWIPVIVS